MIAFLLYNIKPNAKGLLVDKQSDVIASKCCDKLLLIKLGRKWLQFEIKRENSAKQELF